MSLQRPPSSGANRLILEVRFGALSHRKAILAPRQVLRVGRAKPAGFAIPSDEMLAAEHFELAWDGITCHLRDLGSGRGTQLGGESIQDASVPHGGWLRAGRTDFSVYFESFTPPRPAAPPEPESLLRCRRRAFDQLRAQPGSLFMLLDAAKDERIPVLLRESVEEYRSLYEGPQGDVLAGVAPYLVALPRDSRLLEALVLEGWGKNWGVFLYCDLPLDDVRRHLRHFLMVEDPKGRLLYFRFYDPRVLGAFISTCTAEDALRFYGPIGSLCLEDHAPEWLLRLSAHPQGTRHERLKLDQLDPEPSLASALQG